MGTQGLSKFVQVVTSFSAKTGPLATGEALYTALAEMDTDGQSLVPVTAFMQVLMQLSVWYCLHPMHKL